MTTTTAFFLPSIIEQVHSVNSVTGRPSIQWDHSESIISTDSAASTRGTLYTISGFWQEKFYSETSQLNTSGYNIPANSGTLVGIELSLNARRVARIQDLVIQLILNGELIGENRASLINPIQADMYTADTAVMLDPIDDFNIYGSSTDLWGTTLSAQDITDASFGVAISFRSNMIYPHRDTVYLDQVGIRLTYA
jgi:hypothetical protein